MSNRQLLEDAARAAGMDGWYYSERGPRGPGMYRAANGVLSWSNPLVDDGDALRLAVKLHLWEAIRIAHRLVSNDTDIYAATRRAIVRAAAEIGKGLAHD